MSAATIAPGSRTLTLFFHKGVLADRYNRPKKVTPAPDPAIIQSLEQKIGKLKISLEEAAAA